MPLPAPFDRLRLPVIGSPLFIVSGPELVIAQCKAGIVGAFPALNARPSGVLDEWMHRITEELAAHDRDYPERPSAPFAVNQIVHRSNARLEEDMAVCEKWKVPLVITSLGARTEVFDAVRGWGGITLHDVIDDRFARKAMVGSGDRSERIRTYNFPQGRVTDHRIGLTLHKLPEVLAGPGLAELVDALIAEDEAKRLAALGE